MILLYHSVARERLDPWSLCVTPEHFDQHLSVLNEQTRTIPLQQLITEVRSGYLSEDSVVVTFDDGYSDNYHKALPLLQKHRIPATVFVTTGQLGANYEFWWDELEHILLRPGVLPDRLELSIEGITRHWELKDDAECNSDRWMSHIRWKAWEKPPTARHRIYYELWQLFQPLDALRRDATLAQLSCWAGCSRESRPAHRVLSMDELSVLAENELVSIGSHTTTHPLLSGMSIAGQQLELQKSKTILEDLLQRSVNAFSYPYGNYNHDTVTLAQESGYECACAVGNSAVRNHDSLFELPRIQVADCDGEEFARQLERRQASEFSSGSTSSPG